MKTKIIVLLAFVALLPFSKMLGQEGRIIVTDFEPDLSIDSRYTPNDTIKLDVDGDGTVDLKYYWRFFKWEVSSVLRTSIGWGERAFGFEESDTVITDTTYYWHALPYTWTFGSPQTGGCWEKSALRKTVGNQYCYGWIHIYRIDSIWHMPQYPNIDRYKYTLYIDKMAFCTTPDYPLDWGQTSFSNVDDSSALSSTLYPNPTTGMVTISGENLRQAEVINMLGQQVLSIKGEDNQLQIDMAALPAGIYFVAITDDEGRKCVRKVVKE